MLECGERLAKEFYAGDTKSVARDLIGKALLRKIENEWVGGWIVETEAYLATRDPASHSARGKTPCNASMFGPAGTLYVYPIHAKYCLNAVTEVEGAGCAVLIRAIEPVWGIEMMKDLRIQQDLRRLTSGPAMLCQALGVDRNHDGLDLPTDDEITIRNPGESKKRRIVAAKRIGISKAKDRLLRFVDAESDFLSRRVAK